MSFDFSKNVEQTDVKNGMQRKDHIRDRNKVILDRIIESMEDMTGETTSLMSSRADSNV